MTIDEMIRTAVRDAVRDALDGIVEPQSKEPQPKLLTKREVAKALSVCEKTVDNLRKRGMPCTYVGDSPRYDLAAILAWLATQKKRSAA